VLGILLPTIRTRNILQVRLAKLQNRSQRRSWIRSVGVETQTTQEEQETSQGIEQASIFPVRVFQHPSLKTIITSRHLYKPSACVAKGRL